MRQQTIGDGQTGGRHRGQRSKWREPRPEKGSRDPTPPAAHAKCTHEINVRPSPEILSLKACAERARGLHDGRQVTANAVHSVQLRLVRVAEGFHRRLGWQRHGRLAQPSQRARVKSLRALLAVIGPPRPETNGRGPCANPVAAAATGGARRREAGGLSAPFLSSREVDRPSGAILSPTVRPPPRRAVRAIQKVSNARSRPG